MINESTRFYYNISIKTICIINIISKCYFWNYNNKTSIITVERIRVRLFRFGTHFNVSTISMLRSTWQERKWTLKLYLVVFWIFFVFGIIILKNVKKTWSDQRFPKTRKNVHRQKQTHNFNINTLFASPKIQNVNIGHVIQSELNSID